MSDQTQSFFCRFPNCFKTYTNKYNLQRHIECNHRKIKRFRCRQCGKYLSSKQNLQEHRNTHTKLKPYECKEPFCGQTFRQSSQLSNHKKLHREILALSLKQREFRELKVRIMQLTDVIQEKTSEIYEITSPEDLGALCLPEISKPQVPVTLPGLPFFSESGEQESNSQAQKLTRIIFFCLEGA